VSGGRGTWALDEEELASLDALIEADEEVAAETPAATPILDPATRALARRIDPALDAILRAGTTVPPDAPLVVLLSAREAEVRREDEAA
jgi:hypothetical protein